MADQAGPEAGDQTTSGLAPTAGSAVRGTRLDRAAVGFSVALVSLPYAFLVPLMQLWKADPRVPFMYQGDAMFHSLMFKAVLDHGWYERNPDMGAPFGAHLHDFPIGDNLHFVFAKALGLFTDEFGVLVNAHFLAGFGLAALAAGWSLHLLGVSRRVSVVLAVLYALLPYHFERGEQHLFLAAYYPVPVAVLLAVLAMRGEPFRGSRWRLVGFVGACLLIGSASTYYAIFTILLLAGATAVALLRYRRASAAALGAILMALVGVVGVANLLPDVLYAREHGQNEVARRRPSEAEFYSLKLSHMVLPVEGHRVERLAQLRDRYQSTFPVASEGPSVAMGTVTAMALVWVLVVPVLLLAGLRRLRLDRRHREAAVLVLWMLALATTGGLSSIISLLGFTQLRAWNRISIFVAFVALLSLGVLLDALLSRIRGATRARPLAIVGLAALLVVGVWEQTSADHVPPYEANRMQFAGDEAFVHAIEATLPPKAMVFQLPYLPFPEAGPRERMLDYDHARGYLHSRTLRWSYGDPSGRPDTDWQESVNKAPPDTLAPALASVGFAGIYVDRFAYRDHGAALEAGLSDAAGPAVVSRDGRFAFFDLRALRLRIDEGVAGQLRERVLHPPSVRFGPGFFGAAYGLAPTSRWSEPTSTLEITQPGPSTRAVTIEVAVRAAPGAAGQVSMRFPDGTSRTYDVTSEPVTVRVQLTLPPGRHAVPVEARLVGNPTGRDPRHIRFDNPVVTDDTLPSLARGAVRPAVQ